ncbi:MAG: LytTR family transcriptional regulator DNA-binding domain-containing protein [Fermentimonas sp.]|nr:LytTR family transcriptional regulator DNA-binding domain-containing protein [Fermentimonas sp.]
MKLIYPNTAFSMPLKWFTIVVLLVLFALLLTFAFKYLVSFSFSLLLLKNFIDTVFLIVFAVVLEKIIPFTNYVKLDFRQRLINSLALAIISVSVWVLVTYSSSVILFGIEARDEIIKLLPVTALIGSLLYLIELLIINYRTVKLNIEYGNEAELETEKTDKPNAVAVEESNEKENGYLERIALKTGQKIHVILIPDIVYIQSDGDYVQLNTENGKYIKEETMKYFEANLHPQKFVRIHRSYIVNVEKIARIELFEKNSQMLMLKNGHQIKASTTGYKMLREVLNL